MVVVIVLEYETLSKDSKERLDVEGCEQHRREVCRRKLRFERRPHTPDELLEYLKSNLLHADQYAFEIYDPTLSEYITIQEQSNTNEPVKIDLASSSWGKIWRIRATLSNEKTLALPGRVFANDLSNGYSIRGKGFLHIKEKHNQENATAFTVWDGGLLLADYLQACPTVVRGKNVLELGAGVGLVGLTAAALGAEQVTLTDLAEAVPMLLENVTINRSLWESAGCMRVLCSPLNWFHPDPLPSPAAVVNRGWEVILLADCVWILDLVMPLLQTLRELVGQARTCGHLEQFELLISYQRRGHHAHEAFWDGIATIFDVEELCAADHSVVLPNPKLLLRRCKPK